MSNNKSILESAVIIRFFVFAVLIAGLLIALFSLKPDPRMSAEVADSEFIKPYEGRQRVRLAVSKNSNDFNVFNKKQKVVAAEEKPEPQKEANVVSSSKPGTISTAEIGLDSNSILEKAISKVDSGDFAAARDLLESALEKDPKNEQLLVELGMIYLIDYRQPENALPYLERALLSNPSNKVVLSEIVGVYQEIGQQEAGVEFVRNLLDKNPDNGELNLGMGQMLMAGNKETEAISYLEKAINAGDQPDYVYSDLAELYSKSGKQDKAISIYEKSVAKAKYEMEQNTDPNFKDLNEDILDRATLNLARELRRSGREKEAEDAIKSILTRRPQHQEALYQLGQLLQRRG